VELNIHNFNPVNSNIFIFYTLKARYHTDGLIDWCLMPTLAVYQSINHTDG